MAPVILNLASTPRHGRFNPPGQNRGAHLIEGWVGPTVGLDFCIEQKKHNSQSNKMHYISFPEDDPMRDRNM
jgi:hypothetical protein